MQVYVNCWYVDTNSFHNTGVVFIVPQFIHVLSQTVANFTPFSLKENIEI